MKIQKRLLITILPIVFITSVAVVFTSVFITTQALENKGIDNAKLFSSNYANQLTGKMTLITGASEDMASAVLTAINVETVLIDTRKRYPEFTNIFYTSITGHIEDMSPYDTLLLDEDFSQYDSWSRAVDSKRIELSDPIMYNGESVIIAFAPVVFDYLAEGRPEVIGMVILVYPTKYLFEGINDFTYGETGSIIVLDSHGDFIFKKNEELDGFNKLSDIPATTDIVSVEEAMIALKSGIAKFYINRDRFFISFSPVEKKQWSLGIFASYDEFSKPIYSLYFLSSLILIIGLIVAIINIYRNVRGVVKPIEELTSMAEKINKGDMALRSNIRSNNEMGILSLAINKMLERLSNYNRQLEIDVQERTSDLQVANEELTAMNDSMELLNRELIKNNESIEIKNSEMEAMNEELISTNESLDKNNREIEAMNEELTTTVDQLDMSNRELEITKDALWAEMKLAKKLQSVLLPSDPVISGLEISAFMKTAEQVGGDYYDVINVDGRDWFLIGDVSGHGVTAGLIMMMVQTSIHVALSQNPDSKPEELLTLINRTIHRNISKLGGNRYVTLTVFACMDNGEFSFAGAHLPALLYRKSSDKIEVVETPGAWVGLVKSIDNMNSCQEFFMESGDVLLLYTDGISEAITKDGRVFSQSSLSELFKSNVHMDAKGICDAIKEHSESLLVDDDITAMVLKKVEV